MSNTTITTITPSAASLLIDALKPAHRAILFASVNMFIEQHSIELTEHTGENNKLIKILNAGHKWGIDEARAVKQILFADCFPEDLNVLDHCYIAIKDKL